MNTFAAMQACIPGQELIWLPKSCQLTYGSGRASPALSTIIDQIPISFWGLRLAMKVLEERATRDSKFLPYIRALPAVIHGLPMFFARVLPAMTNSSTKKAACLLLSKSGIIRYYC